MNIVKYDPVKHPHSKKKLKVRDSFLVTEDLICGECPSEYHPASEAEKFKISIVESDLDNVKNYSVVECLNCKSVRWYIQVTQQ